MQTIIIVILAGSAVFFFWFGLSVESGKHRPDPLDPYFTMPLRGYNIDYMIGVAGIAIGLGLAFLSTALFFNQSLLALVGAVLFVLGIIRSLLPPNWVGPRWLQAKLKKESSHQQMSL